MDCKYLNAHAIGKEIATCHNQLTRVLPLPSMRDSVLETLSNRLILPGIMCAILCAMIHKYSCVQIVVP